MVTVQRNFTVDKFNTHHADQLTLLSAKNTFPRQKSSMRSLDTLKWLKFDDGTNRRDKGHNGMN